MTGKTLEISDYEAAEAKVREFAQASGIRPECVGKFGKVNWPGISDLDIAVVGQKNELNLLRKLIAQERISNENFNFILFHDPVYIVDEIAPLAFGFHTFQGLEESTRNYLSTVSQTGIQAANSALRVAWFFFLSEIFSSDLRRNIFEERRSLLIHKNFEETISWLLPTYVGRNDHLRDLYMKGKEFSAEGELTRVQGLAEDLVFGYLHGALSEYPKHQRLNFLRTHRRFAVLVASEGTWRRRSARRLALLHVPEGAVRFLTALSSKEAHGIGPIAVYQKVIKEVYSTYQGSSLPLPYVSPLGLI